MSLALYGIARSALRRSRFRGFVPLRREISSLDLRAIPSLFVIFSEDCEHCAALESAAATALRQAVPGKRRLYALSRQDAEDADGHATSEALLHMLRGAGFSTPPIGSGYQVCFVLFFSIVRCNKVLTQTDRTGAADVHRGGARGGVEGLRGAAAALPREDAGLVHRQAEGLG